MKEKKVVAIMSNDQHLDHTNCDLVYSMFEQKVALAKEMGVKTLLGLGDLLDNRCAQRLDTLLTFKKIVKLFERNEISFIGIAGNHSKTRYDSYDSFDDIFDGFTPYYSIHRDITRIKLGELNITMCPFFIESMMIEKIEADEPNDVFLGHLDMNGSKNNGIVSSGRAINPSMFKKYGKVYLGHYHNEHNINDNIMHLKSMYQSNYGEDEKKGFTLLYEDGSVEHYQADFPRFKEVEIDVDTNTKAQIKKVVKEAKNDYANVRVKLVGSESKVKSFKKAEVEDLGASVRRVPTLHKVDDIKVSKVDKSKSLDDKFKDWCKENGKNELEGKVLIKKCKERL